MSRRPVTCDRCGLELDEGHECPALALEALFLYGTPDDRDPVGLLRALERTTPFPEPRPAVVFSTPSGTQSIFADMLQSRSLPPLAAWVLDEDLGPWPTD